MKRKLGYIIYLMLVVSMNAAQAQVGSEVGNRQYQSVHKSLEEMLNDSGDIDYLIVTVEEFKDDFEPLLDWKRRKGLKSEIITLDEIYANYDEVSLQLEIKSCLSEFYYNRNLKWVLLGGGYDRFPIQYCYGKVNLLEDIEEDSIPTDLFYACFDKSFDWNGQLDSLIGQPHIDFVDIEPEVHVSRIPARNKEQVQAYVQKVLRYEKDPPRRGFVEKMLLIGVKSWNNWDNRSDSHHRSEFMYHDAIESIWHGDKYGFYDTGTDFPSGDDYNVSVSNLSQQLNEGYAYFHFAGHGTSKQYLMETGVSFSIEDALSLNKNGYGIMLSTTCDGNAFDSESQCINESLLFNPAGGCLGVFGSSRLGLDFPTTEVSLGPSFQFNAKFFEYLFNDELNGHFHSFASICADAKSSLKGNDSGGGMYWYLQYAINPLGDPEMPVYIRNPKEFDNVKIYRWGSNLVVNTGGVERCRIGVTSARLEDGYQQRADNVSFHTFTDVPEDMHVTITHPDYVPYEYTNQPLTSVHEGYGPGMALYPNPVQTYLNLDIFLNEGSYMFIDLNGRMLANGPLSQGMNRISMLDFNPGIYILQVFIEGEVFSYKVVRDN
ncbi:C25 family cysteine peptidase [Bacteroidota bacterium]